MEALPLNVSIPHLQTSARLFNEMLKQYPTSARVIHSATGRLVRWRRSIGAAPVNPNQAFGRSPAESHPGENLANARGVRARLSVSVLVVDDVPDVTEMIGLFLKHAGYEVATADSATGGAATGE